MKEITELGMQRDRLCNNISNKYCSPCCNIDDLWHGEGKVLIIL